MRKNIFSFMILIIKLILLILIKLYNINKNSYFSYGSLSLDCWEKINSIYYIKWKKILDEDIFYPIR
jgi:hypothetical protein